MLSYETLAVIVLALSATPAFSVPVLYALRISSPGLSFLTSVITLRRDNQQQARAAIEEEPASGSGGLLSSVLKNVGISAGLGVAGDLEKHFFGNHNHTRREPTPFHFPHFFPAIDRREPLSAGSVGKTALGLIGSEIGSEIASHFLNHNHTR